MLDDEAGTRPLADLGSLATSSFVRLGSLVFFPAANISVGAELWAVSLSDGCAGDCDGDGVVTIAELIRLVALALGEPGAAECGGAGAGDGEVSIDDLVAAVDNALVGCGSAVTTPDPDRHPDQSARMLLLRPAHARRADGILHGLHAHAQLRLVRRPVPLRELLPVGHAAPVASAQRVSPPQPIQATTGILAARAARPLSRDDLRAPARKNSAYSRDRGSADLTNAARAADRRPLNGGRRMRVAVGMLAVTAILLAGGCGDDNDCSSAAAPTTIVLAPEGEDLNAYDPAQGFAKQAVISGNEDESRPDIPAVNGQVCFDPTKHGRFAVADDHTQPNPPPHWTIMELHGQRVGELSYTVLNEITPTYQTGLENADPVGCAFLRDGRLLTTDIGNNETGPENGQLTLWFPPLDSGTPHSCKLDVTIGTAGAVYVDEQQRIYVASARGHGGIYRYTGPFPTSDTAAGGCGAVDATAAPLADAVQKELFISPANGSTPTPNAIVGSGHGTFYVSSVLNGVIAEFDANGRLKGRILQPPVGEHLGSKPFSTGSPFGLGVDADGNVYYSDLGLVVSAGSIGPGNHTGTVRRIRFENGVAQPPDTMDSNLRFPDGIGVFQP